MSLTPKEIIATWLYLEGVGEDGIYPQVPGRSSTSTFHDIYKRCLVTFFTSARATNESAELFLFSNIDLNLGQRDFDRKILNLLKKLRVSIIVLPYTFTPPHEQKMWRNQFFVMDVLKYFSNELKEADLCLILDSDIIWSGSTNTKKLWTDLSNFGSLTMTPILDNSELINGLTVKDLETTSKLMGILDPPRQYAGGEFIALRGDKLSQVFHSIEILWDKYISYVSTGEMNFMEEAHFLSIIYASLQFPFGNGNRYVKRIWTQVLHYSNRDVSDRDLTLWHLPAEKRFGIRRIADKYISGKSQSWPEPNSGEWINLTYKLGLAKGFNSKLVLDVLQSVKDRVWKSLLLNFVGIRNVILKSLFFVNKIGNLRK